MFWVRSGLHLDQMFRGIYSGLKPFFPERCGRHSDEPEAQSPARRTCLCWDILLSLFSKHNLEKSLGNMVVLVLAVLDSSLNLSLSACLSEKTWPLRSGSEESHAMTSGYVNKQHCNSASYVFACGNLRNSRTPWLSPRTIHQEERFRSRCADNENMCPWIPWYHRASRGCRYTSAFFSCTHCTGSIILRHYWEVLIPI